VEGSSVFTVSLGASRIFRLKNDKTGEVQDIDVQSGSLFILGPKTNAEWKHSIVKCSTSVVSNTRISVTMRSIATRLDPNTGKIVEGKKKKKIGVSSKEKGLQIEPKLKTKVKNKKRKRENDIKLQLKNPKKEEKSAT